LRLRAHARPHRPRCHIYHRTATTATTTAAAAAAAAAAEKGAAQAEVERGGGVEEDVGLAPRVEELVRYLPPRVVLVGQREARVLT